MEIRSSGTLDLNCVSCIRHSRWYYRERWSIRDLSRVNKNTCDITSKNERTY